LFIERLHRPVSFGSCRHLNKGKALWTPGELIHDEVCIDDFAKGAEKLENFRFGYIIRQIAYKEFQAVLPGDYDRQESLSATTMQENCTTTDKKNHA
jgi:hypothetical protein